MYFLIRSFEHIWKKSNIIPILKIRKLKVKENKSTACQNLDLKPELKSMLSLLLQAFMHVKRLMQFLAPSRFSVLEEQEPQGDITGTCFPPEIHWSSLYLDVTLSERPSMTTRYK